MPKKEGIRPAINPTKETQVSSHNEKNIDETITTNGAKPLMKNGGLYLETILIVEDWLLREFPKYNDAR